MKIFDQYAKNYDQWYERPFGSSVFGLEVACLKRVIRPFSLSLEVGVGSGRFAQALGIQYGLDPSMELLKFARQRDIRGGRRLYPSKAQALTWFLWWSLCAFLKNHCALLKKPTEF
jgi:ubiquinone/menaquinone biosynthesis C-methylase UbiE